MFKFRYMVTLFVGLLSILVITVTFSGTSNASSVEIALDLDKGHPMATENNGYPGPNESDSNPVSGIGSEFPLYEGGHSIFRYSKVC